jgi:hypothetical protein
VATAATNDGVDRDRRQMLERMQAFVDAGHQQLPDPDEPCWHGDVCDHHHPI